MEKSPKKLAHIPFMEIIKKSFWISWKNKFLWWLGLFLSLLSFRNGSYNWEENQESMKKTADFISQNIDLVITIAAITLLFLITLVVISLIARGGLIFAINEIDNKKEIGFKKSFRTGRKFIGKIFGINFITTFISLFSIAILAVPIGYCFLSGKITIGIILGIPALLIVLSIAILASYIQVFGKIYSVIGKLRVMSALENAYKLFIKNIGPSIIMGLLLIGISVAFSIGTAVVFFILALIFVPLGIVLSGTLEVVGTIGLIIVGLTIFACITLLLSSFFQVFKQTTWLLFFKKIAKSEEEELETESSKEEIAFEKKPEPMSGISASNID